MACFYPVTSLAHYILFITLAGVLSAQLAPTSQSLLESRDKLLFFKSVKQCLEADHRVVFISDLYKLLNRPSTNCRGVIQHFLIDSVSRSSPAPPSTVAPLLKNRTLSGAISHTSRASTIQKDHSGYRMTQPRPAYGRNPAMGATRNAQLIKTQPCVHRFNKDKNIDLNRSWTWLSAKSDSGYIRGAEEGRANRRRREIDQGGDSGDADVTYEKNKAAGREAEGKRARGAWYDVVRQRRRQQVLSVNNALATLTDMMMEQRRNRMLRNRERLRYYMMMQG